MTRAREMLDAYPAGVGLDEDLLARTVDALRDTAQVATACADACLSETPEVLPLLVRCVRDGLDTATICDAAALVLSRHTGYDAGLTRAQVQAAVAAARACRDSCTEQRDATRACAVCADACSELLTVLGELVEALDAGGSGPAAPSPSQAPPYAGGA